VELGPRGSRLWASLTAQDAGLLDEDCPRREVALTACRAADRLESLEQLATSTPFVLEGRSGPYTHPVHVEVRQAGLALARHLAALRLPDEATGKRPQRRQARGVQRPSKTSARDRLKAV
jgi:hypothetical protein